MCWGCVYGLANVSRMILPGMMTSDDLLTYTYWFYSGRTASVYRRRQTTSLDQNPITYRKRERERETPSGHLLWEQSISAHHILKLVTLFSYRGRPPSYYWKSHDVGGIYHTFGFSSFWSHVILKVGVQRSRAPKGKKNTFNWLTDEWNEMAPMFSSISRSQTNKRWRALLAYAYPWTSFYN